MVKDQPLYAETGFLLSDDLDRQNREKLDIERFRTNQCTFKRPTRPLVFKCKFLRLYMVCKLKLIVLAYQNALRNEHLAVRSIVEKCAILVHLIDSID